MDGATLAKKFIKWALGSIGVGTGFVILIVLIFLVIIAGALSNSTEDSGSASTFSPQVLSYREIVERYAEQEGVLDFSQIILAIMQKETAGIGDDPMNASEFDYNTEYLPRVAGSITDPEYSIYIGVKQFARALSLSSCTSTEQTTELHTAVQAYHFGLDWISFAVSAGGYSVDTASKYNKQHSLGKNARYAEQVLNTVKTHHRISNAGFIAPLETPVWGSPYGPRRDGMHSGQDFPCPVGSPLYAVASGVVVKVHRWNGGTSSSEAWGNHVKIKHDDTLYTLYAHASVLMVTEGQTVAQGDIIALSGNTGRSTGPHLHFEVYDGGSATSYRKDPALYLPKSE